MPAVEGEVLTEGQKLAQKVKQLIAESDKLLMTDKGFTRDPKALAEGIKILERAEEVASKASELDPEKFDSLAQTVAMKLYGARKNTTLHLANAPRRSAPPPAAEPAAVPERQPSVEPPPVADAQPASPDSPAEPAEPAPTGRRARRVPLSEPTEARVAETPPAPPQPVVRKERIFVLKDGTRISAARVADTDTEHVIKDIAGKMRTVAKADVAEIIEQETVIGGAPGAAPKKHLKVYVLKDGRKINAVKVLDVGEQVSIKDDRNRFVVVEKTDILEIKQTD